MAFYIAYGSNMWRDQMFSRCPQSAPMRRINLPNRRLVFRTYADLEEAPGETAPAAIYRVTRSCLERLDWYEGVRSGAYFRHTMRLHLPDLGTISAVTYLNGRSGNRPPSDEYVARLRKGYRDWRVHQKHLDKAIAASGYVPPEKRPKPKLPASPNWANVGGKVVDLNAPRWPKYRDDRREGIYDFNNDPWEAPDDGRLLPEPNLDDRLLDPDLDAGEDAGQIAFEFWRSYRAMK